MSRLRGANPFPKQVKATSNPGGVGHHWVKNRFVSPAPPGKPFGAGGLTRVFLPARVADNPHLTAADPGYLKRLAGLGERERRMYLEGDWDIDEGRFFPEFNRKTHVVPAAPPPADWPRFKAIDYGLDMLACLWVAVRPGSPAPGSGRADAGLFVYRELCQSGLIISRAAGAICAAEAKGEAPVCFAPPDLWNRRQESGHSAADIFAEHGLPLARASNNRTQGWLDLKEYLPGIRVAESCPRLIEGLGGLLADPANPCDCAGEPHELTHAPDALRYFIAGRGAQLGRAGLGRAGHRRGGGPGIHPAEGADRADIRDMTDFADFADITGDGAGALLGYGQWL